MISKNNCQQRKVDSGQSVRHKTCDSGLLFENLIWLSTEETTRYLRKSVRNIRVLVYRQALRVGKFWRRLFFRKEELGMLIGTSQLIGGLKWQF